MAIKQNVNLASYSYYKIGGPAKYFWEIRSQDELIVELGKIPSNEKIYILGAGTNILFDDDGFDGLIIFNKIVFCKITGRQAEFGGGTLFSQAINYCIENNLSGLEWAGGLPGTVGGAIFGNAGAFGGETKDNCVAVKSADIATKKIIIRGKKQCWFGYRDSIFKQNPNKEIIISGTFTFQNREKNEIKKSVQEKINYRQSRQPLNFPNLGSTFKNIPVDKIPRELAQKFRSHIKTDPLPVLPVAFLLSQAGLKGKKIGGIQISQKHPNFLINLGNGKSADVLKLVEFAKSEIRNRFGIGLETEISFVAR